MRRLSRGAFLRTAAAVAGGALAASWGSPALAQVGPAGFAPNGAVWGTLAGRRDGRTVEYVFDYPGREDVYTIDVNISPDSIASTGQAGFQIYSPNGSVHVKGGVRRGLNPNLSADLISRNAGQHVLQIFNYSPDVAIDYEVRIVRGRPERETTGQPNKVSGRPIYAYVGSYTAPGGGGKGHGEGIYVLRYDPVTGALSKLQAVGGIPQPSYVTVDPLSRFVYAVGEVSMYEGQRTGVVDAYRIDSTSGRLSFINRQLAKDPITNFASVDPTGRFLLITNYSGASVAVLPIDADGSLNPVSHLVKHEGPPGPLPQQTSPHPHQFMFDPAGRWALAPDLGLDRVYVYALDTDSGQLIPNDPPYFQMHLGAGSRHITWHPSGRFAYVNGERDTTITAFTWDTERGVLEKIETQSTTPPDYTGQKWSSHIAVHPNGQYLYVANRRHDSMAVFQISQETGKLTLLGWDPTGGEITRSWNFDPSGRFLYTTNQDGDTIWQHQIGANGRLTQIRVLEIATPTSIVFAQP